MNNEKTMKQNILLPCLPNRTPIWLRFGEAVCRGSWARRMLREGPWLIETNHETLELALSGDKLGCGQSHLSV